MIYRLFFLHVFKVVSECIFYAILTDLEPQLEILWRAFLREFPAFEGKVSAKSEVEKIFNFDRFLEWVKRQGRASWKMKI